MPAANTKAMMPAAVFNPTLEIPIDDITLKTYCTAGANGWLIEDIIAINKDTSNARIIEVYLSNGISDSLIGSASIPAGSGLSGTPNVKLMSALGLSLYTLQASYLIKVRAPIALTSVIQLTPYRIYDYVAL